MQRRILFLIVLGILTGYAWWRYDHRDGRHAQGGFTPAALPRLSLDDVKVLSAVDAEYTRLVQSVVPGVVSITSSRMVTQLVPLTLGGLQTGLMQQQTGKSTSLGSGVIVSKEGHILTNHHVITDTTEIRVQLTDGRNFPATLIGSDPRTDIAVLRIEAAGIEALPFGDSDTLRVGQQVFAVGNPYGLEASVTRGIVSAKGRHLTSDSAVEFLQHDAAVNQGNSGGPLLNVRGEIVGINSQIVPGRTGGWQGISLAIPSATARGVLGAILKNGRVIPSFLGVEMLDITPELAQNLHLADLDGAVIIGIMQGSPAAQCGLQQGDVVRSVDGRRVKIGQVVKQIIQGTAPGQVLELGLIRNGVEMKVKAKVAEVPQQALGR